MKKCNKSFISITDQMDTKFILLNKTEAEKTKDISLHQINLKNANNKNLP
jgi:hypothetical protein